MGPSQFRRLVSTSPENLKKSWMSFFFGISLHLNGHQDCCFLFHKVNGHGMDMRKNLSTHTTWDTKNWLLKSKSPSFPLPDTGKTRTSSAKALPWGKHPPLDKGQTRTRRVPMQLRSQTSGEKRDAAMEMNVRDRRWPGWTVDESCSFPTKAGDPTFLPTNDTLALFFWRGPNPSQISRNPSQNREKYLVVSFRNFFGGIFWLKTFRPTCDWLKFTQPASRIFINDLSFGQQRAKPDLFVLLICKIQLNSKIRELSKTTIAFSAEGLWIITCEIWIPFLSNRHDNGTLVFFFFPFLKWYSSCSWCAYCITCCKLISCASEYLIIHNVLYMAGIFRIPWTKGSDISPSKKWPKWRGPGYHSLEVQQAVST